MNAPQRHPQPVEVVMLCVPCPLHHELVALDGRGHVVGKCNGCARAAALGIRRIERQELRQTTTATS